MAFRAVLWEFVFVLYHVDPRTAKSYALHSQSKPLFGGIFSAELNCAPGAYYAVPRQSLRLMQDAHHLPGGAGPAGGAGDRSVA
jgi:hypothetical protein